MWGNRLGWMISGGIFVVTIALYAMLLTGPSVTAPTALTTAAGAMDALELPHGPTLTGGPADASDLYQQAIAAYKADKSDFNTAALGAKLDSAAMQACKPAMDLLVQATGAGKASIFSDPSAVVIYNPDQFSAVTPAFKLGQVAVQMGLRFNAAKDPENAAKYLKAAYSLGLAMCRERLVYLEFMRGQDILRSAALNLSGIDDKDGPLYGKMDGDYRVLMDSLKPIDSLFNPSNTLTISTNAGDIFNLAQHSNERMWKDEAILMLGHFRYNAAQAGDQRGAGTLLAKLSLDKTNDPAAAAAIKAAQALTLDQHNDAQQMPPDE